MYEPQIATWNSKAKRWVEYDEYYGMTKRVAKVCMHPKCHMKPKPELDPDYAYCPYCGARL